MRVLPVKHEDYLKNGGKIVSVHSFLFSQNTQCKQSCQEPEVVMNRRKDVGKTEEGRWRRNGFWR
jgi:hypothetical protein